MVDDIRFNYSFDVSCQGLVLQVIVFFLDGEDFEDMVRNVILLGGDSDIIVVMVGSIVEVYYGFVLVEILDEVFVCLIVDVK